MATPQRIVNALVDDAATQLVAAPCSDQSAFEAVYRQQRTTMLRFLRRRVGDEQDAADLTQEAYLRAWRYRGESPETLKALLFRIAINLVGTRARLHRSQHTASHLQLDELTIMSDDVPQHEALAREQHMNLIVAAIHELPAKRRQVFVLSRFHGMPHKEIAKRCGISVSMVEKHLSKGLAFVRSRVGEVET